MQTKAMGWLCCCLLMPGGDRAWAALSSPFPVEVTQPDGDKVTLFIRGNDKLNWYEFVPEAPNMSREAFSRPENRELRARLATQWLETTQADMCLRN